MRKEVRRVRVLSEHKGHFFFVRTIDDSSVAAVAETEEEALKKLDALMTRLLQNNPAAISPAREAKPILRHLRFPVPAIRMGAQLELPVQLFAICEPLKDKEVGHRVYLPQLDREIEVEDLKSVEMITAEYVRSWFPYENRLEAIIPYTESLMRESGDAKVANFRVKLRTVRFRTEDGDVSGVVEHPPTLGTVGEPLHVRMKRRDAPRAYRRNEEVEGILSQLSETAERSLLLLGPPGCGKTATINEVVYRMVHDRAPEALKNKPVWQISGGRLMAGMRYLGEWQERLLLVIEEAKETGAILYAENLVELLETAGTEQYKQGIPGMLLPYILSGDLVFITEARPEQLSRAEQSHPSFLRALRKIPIEPMSAAKTDAVLERLSFRLGRQFGCVLQTETRERILELVGRFKGSSVLPGPAVELAERVARTKGEGAGKEEVVVTPEDALQSFSSLTGLPVELLDASKPFSVATVRAFFEDVVFAQPEAVESIVDLITCIRSGLNAPSKPLGSFLFLGPTGVGKTQSALTLADYLFGTSDRLVRFDMSEYQDSWSAGRLVGRFKGEPGDLVRKLHEQPFQVVLLDEIEKAHPLVFDYLLQVFGEGRLTDGLGRTVNATSSVFIMTSNLGAGGPSGLGFSSNDAQSNVSANSAHYMSAVEASFRPEFVGRIDRVIPFRPLKHETAQKLVERALKQALAREGLQRREIRVDVDDEVVAFLIRTGFNEKYGARPLRRAVENFITVPLARFLNEYHDAKNVSLKFRLEDGVPIVTM